MIPDYQTLMRPVLEAAIDGPRRIADVVAELEDQFGLTPEERAELLPSGRQAKFANRVHWARSYLKQAGLLKNTRRGVFEITDRGRQVLTQTDQPINAVFLDQFEEFRDFRSRTNSDADTTEETTDVPGNATPDESLQSAHKRLTNALARDLLGQVRAASPAFFEQLIVDLLIAMGYGGSSQDAGRALGQSGDNGVDGVIDQDPLGVDQIYLQAKRYAATNPVGAGDIRDFFGALSLKKASKGIFVTTSYFTSSAIQTADDLGARIVRIDGEQLAKLMIKHNIGCRDREVLHIKQLDEAYFDEDPSV